MVLGVTTSAWAISRLLGPSATRSATRRSPRGERLDAAQGDAAAPRAGGQQLGLGAGGQRRGAAARCQLQRLPQLLARLRAVVGAAQRRSQLGACLGVFELRRRVREHVDRSVEQLQPVLAARDEPCCAQGRAQRPWRPRCGRARVLRPPDGVPGPARPAAAGRGRRASARPGRRGCGRRRTRRDDQPRAAPPRRRPGRPSGCAGARGSRGRRATPRCRLSARIRRGPARPRPPRACPAPSARRRGTRPTPRGSRLPPWPARLATRRSARGSPSRRRGCKSNQERGAARLDAVARREGGQRPESHTLSVMGTDMMTLVLAASLVGP